MSRFSKVSSIFGRDAFATMRYVTLLNVSKIRDISNDERKVPFKNDEYLASGTSSFRKACIIHQRQQNLEITVKTKCGKAITIVLGWQKPLFGGCKMLYSH